MKKGLCGQIEYEELQSNAFLDQIHFELLQFAFDLIEFRAPSLRMIIRLRLITK